MTSQDRQFIRRMFLALSAMLLVIISKLVGDDNVPERLPKEYIQLVNDLGKWT